MHRAPGTEAHPNPLGPALAYAAGIAVALLAALPWIVTGQPAGRVPYLLFLAAVIVASWSGGLGPGLLATATDTAVVLATTPSHWTVLLGAAGSLDLALFLLAAISLSYFSGALRRLDAETECRARDARRDMAGAIARHLDEGVVAVDRQARVTFANPAALRMFDAVEPAIRGLPLGEVIAEDRDAAPRIVSATRETLRSGVTRRIEAGITVRPDASRIVVDVVCSPIRSSTRTDGAVLAFRDISERHAFEEQLRHQALHDGLTGLPNRTLFDDRLGRAIATAHREATPFALLLIDLDRFKEVNDTFGHGHGDQLLHRLGPRLQGALRETDTVARLGGDEFGVILPASDHAVAALVAENIAMVVREPFPIEGKTAHVEGAIGIAIYPQHGRDAATLISRADMAMYAAKHRRKTRQT